ncbi:hypothetical protein BDQ94DRAFT_46106 [Aspergillus welwitschiae]|uniref:Uncharacterized protein n=1 Tax=Aspergillus welwitschiae TaxID=1341132 RepID=A0A3F3QIW9_9EURO|nr:hypothetical protein BDQ94DRAFT_46106 [Aspergillus welwitschiae]RDH38616.1 hypothetical protein BDQ94DRAFT_46106 [Aspergillus welwitschiae]
MLCPLVPVEPLPSSSRSPSVHWSALPATLFFLSPFFLLDPFEKVALSSSLTSPCLIAFPFPSSYPFHPLDVARLTFLSPFLRCVTMSAVLRRSTMMECTHRHRS